MKTIRSYVACDWEYVCLTFGILSFAVPLSILEAFIAALIIKKAQK